MIVDILLKMVGENVSQYQNSMDKWIAVIVRLWGFSTVYLSYVLFFIVWLWFFWQKKRGSKITKKKIIITIIVSILLFWLGSQIPWWIIEAIGGASVRGIYGGQI